MLKFFRLVFIEESTDGLMAFERATQIFHKKGRGFIRAEADSYGNIQKIAKKHPGGLFFQNALEEFVPLSKESQPSILII